MANYGKTIKYIRKKRGLTQSELADGICTRRHIINIESGKVIPSSYYLELFSKKLNINIMSLISYSDYNDPIFVFNAKNKIDKLKSEHNYEELFTFILNLKSHEDFSTGEAKQYINWHEAVCEYKYNKNYSNSVNLFNTILGFDKSDILDTISKRTLTHQELEILNSYANCLFEKGDNTIGIKILEYIDLYLENLDFLTYSKFQIKVLYNLSKALNMKKNYSLSLSYTERALKFSFESNYMFFLGQLYYQKAVNLFYLDKKNDSLKYFVWAHNILNMQSNSYLREILLKQTNEKYDLDISKYILY